MKVYIIVFLDESSDDEILIVKKGFSTKDKAEQHIREMHKLTEDENVNDFLEEMYDLSGTKLEIREYEVD